MTMRHNTAAYFYRRAAEERAKGERAADENMRRLHFELAEILAERALIAQQGKEVVS